MIITGTAGMGKSTFLSSLSLKLKSVFSGLWVLRIDLVNFSKFFHQKMLQKEVDLDSQNKAVEMLWEMLCSNDQSKEGDAVLTTKILTPKL